MGESLKLTFVRERETKRTWRFAEQTPEGQPEMIGTIYMQKHALNKLGDPEYLSIEITGTNPAAKA